MSTSSFALTLALLFCIPTHAQISKIQFDSIVSDFETIYSKKIKSDLDLNLRLESYWQRRSPITASQARIVGNEAIVFIDGDLAHKAHSNTASLVLELCHEFGHLYNDKKGVPKLTKEGNADYWAAQCALDYFSMMSSSDDSLVLSRFLKDNCQMQHGVHAQPCQRVMKGIHGFAFAFNVDTRDVIDNTVNDRVKSKSFHPTPLCRVKTYIAGLFGQNKPECIYEVDETL